MSNISTPFAHPLYMMAKPAGPMCNLSCRYCYYLEKSDLYQEYINKVMSDTLLENFIDEYITSQTMPNVLFTWHGGEPLMRPLSFYKNVIKLQKQYSRGRNIDNCIQTNGTLLTDEWCQFLHDNKWLVGISIDGPQEFHDKYRRNKLGMSSFYKVMNGIRLLNKHQVEWNAMAVINDNNVEHPLEFYHFFKDINCHYIQFSPIVERDQNGKLTPESVTPEQWGNFLCTIFDEWVHNDVGEYYIQLFDATLANWVGVAPGICSMAKTCGHAGIIEFNGDVYSCDHFVYPEYKLGNLNEKTLVEMMYSERQKSFGLSKSTSLPRKCRECKYLFACNGECPKNRFIQTEDCESGLNYLCEGYYKFFDHVAPYMDYMKKELDADRAPANIMKEIR